MKAAKQTLIICWIITVISFVGMVGLHSEVDIWMQKQVTKTEWTYDYEERSFYQGIWSNIFTGAIVSVFMTYVSYGQAKHDLEFKMLTNEQIMVMHFTSINVGQYSINLSHPIFNANNHAAACRFRATISDIELRYERLIEASNDYCPFLDGKKARMLKVGKQILQKLWVDVCVVEDTLLIHSEPKDLKDAIESVRSQIKENESVLKTLASALEKYK